LGYADVFDTSVPDLQDLDNQLALLRQFSNRPKQLRRLLASPSKAETSYSDELRRQIDSDVEWLSDTRHHLISIQDADYPACLLETFDPPCFLFGAGDRDALARSQNQVAIVGARKASRYGLNQARDIAGELAIRGITIVSGLALGIDAAAHEGALMSQGITIAVLGTGCDSIYPRRNWRLAEQIQETGLVLSEFPLGTQAYPGNFPRRNRIVTGMCQATLVVEAALRSGSLISARLALSEGREVMAVPGSITNPQARGCHQLIKEGALLVESAQDVLGELGLGEENMQVMAHSPPQITPEQQVIIDCLTAEGLTMDCLMTQVDISIDELTVNLVALEVLGLIHSEMGCYKRSTLS
jgi:DNA processing protein